MENIAPNGLVVAQPPYVDGLSSVCSALMLRCCFPLRFHVLAWIRLYWKLDPIPRLFRGKFEDIERCNRPSGRVVLSLLQRRLDLESSEKLLRLRWFHICFIE